jgi:prephenate dehydratase
MRYAYLGPEGTFTEAAVASLRGPGTRAAAAGVEAVPYPSIGAVMTAVRAGEAERGVVPVESSVEGIVTATVDDLAIGNDLLIAAETQLEIEFALLARPGLSLADIKTVGGHPQALPQCRRWLTANLPAHEWVPQASNAEAARQVAEGRLDAALAGAFAAAKYDLQVVVPDVHDRVGAVTRFLVVVPPGELPAPTKADRTSLAAFLKEDHPGALLEILTEFAVRGVNLTTIQSRPTGEGLGNYFFFIDCEGHIDDTRVGEAMVGLRRVCAEVRFFGSYPRSDGGRTQVRAGTSNQEFAEALAWLGRLRFGRALFSGGWAPIPGPCLPWGLRPPSTPRTRTASARTPGCAGRDPGKPPGPGAARRDRAWCSLASSLRRAENRGPQVDLLPGGPPSPGPD